MELVLFKSWYNPVPVSDLRRGGRMERNKSPSDNTIRILCGKAAGMCEFEGCNKRLFYDNL